MGGGELNSNSFEQYLLDLGLCCNIVTCPDTPSSNGVAERAVRTLSTDTRARLAMSGIPKRLWHYAMIHSAAARNRLANQHTAEGNPTTPAELFYGRRPDMSHSVAFGAPCLVSLQGPALQRRGRLSPRAVPGRVLHHGGDGVQRDGTIQLLLGYVVLLDDGAIHSSHTDRRTPAPRRQPHTLPLCT